MGNYDYAQGVVMARVYEKKLLDRAKLERLIDAKDAQEAFNILMESEYAKSADGVIGPQEYEILLKNETSRLFKQGSEMLNDKRILEILSLKYDYHNLKTMLKSRAANKDLSELFIHSSDTDPVKIKHQLDSQNYSSIRSEFKKALEEAEKKYSETSNPQMIDIIVDKIYFEHLLSIAKSLDIDMFTDYVKGIIDFYNISAMLRSNKMGAPSSFLDEIIVEGGDISKNKIILLSREDFERVVQEVRSEKIGSSILKYLDDYKEMGLKVIDSAKEDYLNRLNQDSRFVTFGPEPIFAYLLAKEKEIAIVRMIMVGKMNNISPAKLRERLGDKLV